MPQHASDSSRVPHSARRWLKLAAVAVAMAVAAYALWRWANDMSGVRRDAPKVTAIIPLPPPPPPPPEPEKPPEPEQPKEEPVATPEPEPQPTPEPPKPQDEAPPRPADDLANPMQIDGDAQAGNDGFNVGAGKGGGMAGAGGGGLGTGTFKQYLAGVFQRLLREDPQLRKKAYAVQADLWLSGDGEVTRVELAESSGDADTDAQVLAALRATPRLKERTPASLTLPVRLSLKGRRPE